jgi:serine/threonine protein kinase
MLGARDELLGGYDRMSTDAPVYLPGVPSEGELIAGKYCIEKLLGHGGMGVVLKAQHLQLQQPVAIKFLLPDVLRLKGPVERFLREARAAVRIQNEHVAKVLDVGQLDSGLPYMVMEYLDGRDLGDLIEKEGPLPFDEAVLYVCETCEAIAEAHALGIIHRDLKPSNLFLSRAGRGTTIKVLDFGISKLEHDSSGKLTTTNIAMGSPHYMSPEHIKNPKGCDARSDIWSLGMVLYELLTGRTAFSAESLPALFVAIATEEPKPILELRPGIPADLAASVMRCLRKNPDERFQTIDELAEALAPHAPPRSRVFSPRLKSTLRLPGQPAPSTSVPAETLPAIPVSATSVSSPLSISRGQHAEDPPEVPLRRGPLKPELAGVALAAVLGVAALAFTRKAPPAALARSEPSVAPQEVPSAAPPGGDHSAQPHLVVLPVSSPVPSDLASAAPLPSTAPPPQRSKKTSPTAPARPTNSPSKGPSGGVRGMLDDRR